MDLSFAFLIACSCGCWTLTMCPVLPLPGKTNGDLLVPASTAFHRRCRTSCARGVRGMDRTAAAVLPSPRRCRTPLGVSGRDTRSTLGHPQKRVATLFDVDQRVASRICQVTVSTAIQLIPLPSIEAVTGVMRLGLSSSLTSAPGVAVIRKCGSQRGA